MALALNCHKDGWYLFAINFLLIGSMTVILMLKPCWALQTIKASKPYFFCLFWPIFLKDIATYFCLRERTSRNLTFSENWSESWGNMTSPRRRQIHSQNQRHANNVFFSKNYKNNYMDYGPSLTSPFSLVVCVFQILPFWYQSWAWFLKHFYANQQNATFNFFY